MGTKLTKAPVYYVLAQIRFNPVLGLDKYMPILQEEFRQRGYPDFEQGVISTFQISANVEGGQVPPINVQQYSFYDMHRTHGFVLTQQSLAYLTVQYEGFDEFLKTFISAFEFVNSTFTLSFIERIGLRYVNAVYPTNGLDIAQYLDPALHGLGSIVDGDMAHSFCETLMKIDDVRVLSRVMILNGQTGVPADLAPITLALPEAITSQHGRHIVLDTDGFIQLREEVNISSIREKIVNIHSVTSKVFKATVTKLALEEWE